MASISSPGIGSGLDINSIITQLVAVLNHFPQGRQPFPVITGELDDVRSVGTLLFTQYNLPFQVIGVLILVATIGVVVLSKRELK